jgi:hypothetical protein
VNLFQWVTLPVLLGLLLVDLVLLARRHSGRVLVLVRSLAWVMAALTIAHPELAQELANVLGIHRGTDLVLYLFVLAFLGASLFFYAGQVRLRRELTEIVRHVAIHEARHGSYSP